MKRASRRRREAVRFLKWIQKYSSWWYLICTPGDEHMNMRMMKMLIEKLKKEKFYEMIFVLCMVHRNEGFMEDVPGYLLRNMAIKSWETGAGEMIDSLTRYLE